MTVFVVRVLSVTLVLLHAAGFGPWQRVLWGTHAYAFLPWPWFVAATGVLLGVIAQPRAAAAWLLRAEALLFSSASSLRWRTEAVIGLAAVAVFALARVRHLLLGDGLPLTASVVQGRSFHPLEPLSMAWNVFAGSRLAAVLARGQAPDYEAAWAAIAFTSIVAGGLFSVVVWRIVKESGHEAGGDPGPGSLAWWLILSQGYVLIFFGYVENYALATLGLALYLWQAVRYLSGRVRLLAPGLALLLAIGLHFSAVALVGSFLVLVLGPGRMVGRRGATVRDLSWLGAATIVGVAALQYGADGYDPTGTLGGLFRDLATGFTADAGSGSAVSRLTGVTNSWLLAGPWGGVAAVAALGLAVRFRALRSSHDRMFYFASCATALLVSLAVGDSNLGFARNWDLLAPWSFLAIACGTLMARQVMEHIEFRTSIVIALTASVFHVAPWVAVNAHEPTALRRFESLPLGAGRTESTLGYWHALRGRPAEAESWLHRSLAVEPRNSRAWLFLGRLAYEEGRDRAAVLAFDRATELRPDLEEAWRGTLRSLWRLRDDAEFSVRADRAIDIHGNSARLLAARGVARAISGDSIRARADLHRAIRLQPGLGPAVAARQVISTARGDTAALRRIGERLLAGVE